MDFVLDTERLRLRAWQSRDHEPFAAINADRRVREFFPALMTREESDASIRRFEHSQVQHGFCFWAAELRETSELIGFVGLERMSFQLPNVSDPAVEIGWRLTPKVWSQGLATEGARAALGHAFTELGIAEVVAITVPSNLASRTVMEKLGMTHDERDDFDHPRIPHGHPLEPHVLYRIRRTSWSSV